MAEERHAPGLGGMGGEDRPDIKPAEKIPHLLLGDTGFFQALKGGRDRIVTWCGPFRRLPLGDSAQAMMLLGHVDQMEVEGEGANDVEGEREGKRLDAFL